MDTALRDFLRQRHAFDSWPKPTPAEADATTLDLTLDGSELPSWTLVRHDRRKEAAIVSIQSLWTRSEGELLAIDVHSCASLAAAYEALLEWLGEYQSPLISRQPSPVAGSISFAMPGDTAILFARGGLAVQMRNAGPKVQALTQLAVAVDRALLHKKAG
jgi:hypothetical protein